jgi:hypothetical protein
VAVEEERFDRARRLKDAIGELLVIGPTLGALEVEKKRFVEKQVIYSDYFYYTMPAKGI